MSSITINKEPVQKKTFNIEKENIKDMEKLIAPRKQTEFVNRAIRQSLSEMKKERAKKKAIASLEKLYSMRKPSVDGRTAVELVREARHERAEHLYNLSQSNLVKNDK